MASLAQALDQYGHQAYLLTVSPDGPHTSHVDVALDGRHLSFAVGGTAQRNARVNGHVSLLWPPSEAGGYTMIVNGLLTLDRDDLATVAISKSVLHRPGPSPVPGAACSSDCRQLSLD